MSIDLNKLSGLFRIEGIDSSHFNNKVLELTHETYNHEQIHGQYCTIHEHIKCPPEFLYNYMLQTTNLAEWTYSLREFSKTNVDDLYCMLDMVEKNTKIYCRTVANKQAMTIDYHCAWDQADDLWMIYLYRIIPAELVIKEFGSVVIWTNCCHPYYLHNPYPALRPEKREIWVGDLWPFFPAGHYLEMQNLKIIAEYRYQQQLKQGSHTS